MNVEVPTQTNAPSPPSSGVGGSWIEKTSGVCDGEARIRKTRITVGGLVEWRELGLSDREILDRYPSLAQTDLAAAWAYYDQHRRQIQEAIRENEES